MWRTHSYDGLCWLGLVKEAPVKVCVHALGSIKTEKSLALNFCSKTETTDTDSNRLCANEWEQMAKELSA